MPTAESWPGTSTIGSKTSFLGAVPPCRPDEPPLRDHLLRGRGGRLAAQTGALQPTENCGGNFVDSRWGDEPVPSSGNT